MNAARGSVWSFACLAVETETWLVENLDGRCLQNELWTR